MFDKIKIVIDSVLTALWILNTGDLFAGIIIKTSPPLSASAH